VAVTILLISNLWINPTIGGSTPSSVRDCVIAIGSTLLKAPSMSRKAISVYSLPPSVAPNWLTYLWSIVALTCRLIIPSKPFSRNGVRLIDLKSSAVVWVAFPALGMKTTFVSCHVVGRWSERLFQPAYS